MKKKWIIQNKMKLEHLKDNGKSTEFSYCFE